MARRYSVYEQCETGWAQVGFYGPAGLVNHYNLNDEELERVLELDVSNELVLGCGSEGNIAIRRAG